MGTSAEFERLERLIQLTPQGAYRVELEARLAAGAVTGGSEEEPASTPRQSQELPALPRRGGDGLANEVLVRRFPMRWLRPIRQGYTGIRLGSE